MFGASAVPFRSPQAREPIDRPPKAAGGAEDPEPEPDEWSLVSGPNLVLATGQTPNGGRAGDSDKRVRGLLRDTR